MPPSIFRGVPLPELTNEEHFEWVFTHPSVAAIPPSVRAAESVMGDYERY